MPRRPLATLYLRQRGPRTPKPVMLQPRDVANVLCERLGPEAVEVFGVLCLNARLGVIGYHELARGTLDAAIVDPRDVYKVALYANARAVVVGHNHPSGDPAPSPEDVKLTHRLKEAGKILGIDFLDHIIVVKNGSYYSFKTDGQLNSQS